MGSRTVDADGSEEPPEKGPPRFSLPPPSPLPERHLDTLQDYVMDFAPLPEGRLPETLINCLRQVKARMDDFGPPLSASGLCWSAGGSVA
jgi:hypothetical protein